MPALDLFAFLDGTSPWWWVALALAIAAAEVVTFTYFLIWLALGAFTVAALLFAAPETGGTAQVVTFAGSTLVYGIAGWAWLRARRRGDAEPGSSLNRRAARLVGRRAVVTDGFAAGIGKVEIDGVAWRARLAEGAGREADPGEGEVLRVVAADGMMLEVAPDRS